MITYKQLSLADFFTDCQNKFDNDKYEFLSILDETSILMKLFQCLSFLIFMLPPEDLASICFIRCSRLCYYSLFSPSPQHLS